MIQNKIEIGRIQRKYFSLKKIRVVLPKNNQAHIEKGGNSHGIS